MKIDNMAGRAAATLLGLALASGGASLLFGDVIFGHAVFTQKHFQTVCIVFGTTIAAYAAHHAWNNRHLAACLGLAAIAAAGTGLIVWNSLGRQTEGVMVASGAYDKIVGERRDLEASLARDRASINEKRAAADKECASGEGSRCRGARSSVAFYENSAKGTEARLKLLETPKPVDPSAEAFGNLAAALGFDKEKAKALSMLFMPYFVVLFFEFGTTISFGYAFSPKRLPKSAPNQTQLGSVTDDELATLREAFKSEPSNRSDREGGAKVIDLPKRPKPDAPSNFPNRRMTREEIRTDLMLRSATDRQFGSQKEAAEFYGYSESRFSELSKAWEAEGLIPARRMVGRSKQLTKA
jgi:hypothetical protein